MSCDVLFDCVFASLCHRCFLNHTGTHASLQRLTIQRLGENSQGTTGGEEETLVQISQKHVTLTTIYSFAHGCDYDYAKCAHVMDMDSLANSLKSHIMAKCSGNI